MASPHHRAWTGGNEGFVSTWYLDPVHIPTIGHGLTWENDIFRAWWMAKYNRKFQRGDTISLQDSLAVLGLILDRSTLPAVERVMPGAKINVKEASSDTAYNAGNGSLKWKWAQAFAAGQVKQGADLLVNTAVTGRGSKKKLPGLVRRRAEAATLAEKGLYPTWVSKAMQVGVEAAPGTYMADAEIRDAQLILAELGYKPGTVDGIIGPHTKAAIIQFQKDHGTLKVDGILGKATMTALVRTRDFKRKGAGTVVGGTVTAGTGGVAEVNGVGDNVPVDIPATPVTPDAPTGDLGWVGDVLLWGGLAAIVLGLAYLAWRYRDELPTIIRRIA